jgi:hypothetical protein
MGNELANPAVFGQLPAALRGQKVNDNLSAGIQSGFPVLGFRGKVWRVRHRGDESILRRPDDGSALTAIDLIVVHAPPNLSKTYYKDGFVEGSNAPPDCFSLTAVAPEPSSPELQNPTCADCKWNVWGSKITPAGKKGKACQDGKRLAVMLAASNRERGAELLQKMIDFYGGPLLLRVPAASLSDLATFGKKMNASGYPTNAIVTRIKFDEDLAYPKFIFDAVRALTDEEYELVEQMRTDGSVERILNTPVEVAEAPAKAASPFLQGGPQAAPRAAVGQGAGERENVPERPRPMPVDEPGFSPAPVGGGDVGGSSGDQEGQSAPESPKVEVAKAPKKETKPKVAAAPDIKKDEPEDAEYSEPAATGVDDFDSILDGMLTKS